MKAPTDRERVYQYHDGTKHSFKQFARSLGYLDWASQPRPFRSYAGAERFDFVRDSESTSSSGRTTRSSVPYPRLFAVDAVPAMALTAAAIGDLLRHALGLSAWKVLGAARWALRVNPSSGNLHPTEAYLVTGPLPGLSAESGVWHYAPETHSVERRCVFAADAWPFHEENGEGATAFLIALTSIHWRESWKYGERGFRYCQHDLGHAIGALSVAAALCGWRLAVQPAWPHQSLAALIGIDRDEDYIDAEREDPGCLLLVSAGPAVDAGERTRSRLVEAARGGRWFGRASQLSEDHVQWTFIDEVAAATRDPGSHRPAAVALPPTVIPAEPTADESSSLSTPDARQLVLQRRSAVALDGLTWTSRTAFSRMLAGVLPCASVPWTGLWWTPRIHLAIFAHRVTDLAPGLYLLLRDRAAFPRLQQAFDARFAWTPADEHLPLYLLERLEAGAARSRAQRLSCDQAIAADGFFSLGMIADFDLSLDEHGASFYRQLFWESGVIGQALYLAAEAAGARGTGIGCFYDDPVHDTLGLRGHAFQSLYHFTIGMPVEDRRLTTQPGYDWDR